MERQLCELTIFWEALKKPPIICAGDIFDKPNPPPELINWAIHALPPMYAIPGQHDLPYHRYDLMGKSAYWTLVEAGKITNLEPGMEHWIDKFYVVPFPWGYEIVERQEKKNADSERLRLLVAHKYVWIQSCSYPGAPAESMVDSLYDTIKTYDAAVFGDNHKGFTGWRRDRNRKDFKDFNYINCGTFFRRKIDEIDYQPRIGLLYSDGSIQPHYMDVSQDKFIESSISLEKSDAIDIRPFLRALADADWTSVGLAEAIKIYFETHEVSDEAKQIILEALDHGRIQA